MARQQPSLARREREIMDVVYRLGGATRGRFGRNSSDPRIRPRSHAPSYPRVQRTAPAHAKTGLGTCTSHHAASVAQRSAVRHLLSTVFGGSRAAAVAALLDDGDQPLSTTERDALATVVKRLRAEGR